MGGTPDHGHGSHDDRGSHGDDHGRNTNSGYDTDTRDGPNDHRKVKPEPKLANGLADESDVADGKNYKVYRDPKTGEGYVIVNGRRYEIRPQSYIVGDPSPTLSPPPVGIGTGLTETQGGAAQPATPSKPGWHL